MDTIEVLEKARELISDQRDWLQEHSAETATGRWTDPTDPKAVRFCAEGAVIHVAGSVIQSRPAFAQLNRHGRLHHGQTYGSFVKFNDDAEHAEVLEAFDLTIERLKGQS